jgi:hypothetical protein
VKGLGNQQDYGNRIYDPRVGRFLSVDPFTAKYPELTPYQFASNSPIANTDLDGKEAKYYVIDLNSAQPKLKLYKTEKVIPLLPNFLQPDVVSVEVLGLNTTYTFQPAAQQGNFIADFERFKEDPVASIYSGKYVTDGQILSTVVRDIVLTILIARTLRVPDISLEEGLEGAKFAQNGNYSKNFSKEGQDKYSKLAGIKIKSSDDLASAIKIGKVKVSDIPVDYVMINGEKVILNTRTSAALNKAGVPMSKWTGSNKTGVKVPGLGETTFDQLAQDQINNNHKQSEPLSSKPPN